MLTEIALGHCAEYLVDGGVGRQGAVIDSELALQALRDVIPAAAWVNHRRCKLDIYDAGELTRLVKVIETPLLHHLPDNLIGDLQIREQGIY